jgi:PST family polysaccharide transporter
VTFVSYFEENTPDEGHSQKSLRSGAVSLVARAINALIQIGAVLFLARLLTPEDYGLVSMVLAMTGFAPVLVDLGTRDAIVQRARIANGDVSALFWITIAVGVAFTGLTAICGPVIARFYGEPRLTSIVLVSSVTFVAYALGMQHFALLRRSLKFQDIAAVEIAANVLSATLAIAMAGYGFGYWALVVRPVLTPVFLAIGAWLRCRWLPGWPTVTSDVKQMVRFGFSLTGFSLTDFVGHSSDRIAIGYRSGATSLGYYQNALFVYDNLLDVLVFPLHNVAVASLSKLRGDLNELRRSWGKALSVVAFYAMPAFGLLAVTSRDMVVLLLGAKWASAGVLLSVLALRGIPHAIERTLGWLHVTAGRTDRWLRWGLFSTFVQIFSLFCGLPFGPMGVAVAYVVSMFFLFVPALAYAGQPLGICARDVMTIVWRPLMASLTATAIGFTLRFTVLADADPVFRTAALLGAYAASYLILVVGVLKLRAPLSTTQSLLRDSLPAQFAQLMR